MSKFCTTHIKERTDQELETAKTINQNLLKIYGPDSKGAAKARQRIRNIEKELNRRGVCPERREN